MVPSNKIGFVRVGMPAEISIDSFGNRYATLTNLDTNNSWIWTNRDGTPRNIEYSGKWYLYISIG